MPRVPTPPTLSDIWQRGSEEFPGAVASENYAKVVRECEAKYRHWHKVRPVAREAGLNPEIAWAIIKLGRAAHRRSLPFQDTAGQTMTYCLPDAVMREQTLVDQQLAGRITLDEPGAITHIERDRYVINSLMEEAIASSQLEGASTLHRVAKEMLRLKRDPLNKHERMIVNNYRAIQHVRDSMQEPLTVEAIIELQRILTEGTLERSDECGRLRMPGEDVVVADQYGEVLHEPPDASTLPQRLQTLCDFANEDPLRAEPFLHPLTRACALHFQLAYDHPFCDGNGRTARVLFYWMMLRCGYWMFEFMPLSRLILDGAGKYQRAFQYVETDDFDLTYFLVYTADLVARARADLSGYLSRKRKEDELARRAFESEHLNDRQKQVLYEFLNTPGFEWTIEAQQTRFDIAYATGRADLLELEHLGYLKIRKAANKFIYQATDKLLNRNRTSK